MSTATRAKRKDSGSWAIAGNTCAAITASSGRAAVRRSAASSSSSVVTDAGAARGRPPARQEGVAQRLHQIRTLIAAAQQSRPREDSGDRLLDEVLRALARAAQRRRGPQEGTEVRADDLGIEPLRDGPRSSARSPEPADGQRS